MLKTASINEVYSGLTDVYAFRISGEIESDDLTAMAERMNHVFDHREKVDLLIIFERFEGSESGAGFNLEFMQTQFRSLSHIRNYCVVSAPDTAETMIKFFGKLMPVEAHTFELEQEAFEFLRAQCHARQAN